jgi:SAM-dependent MidA family methyltransferase
MLRFDRWVDEALYGPDGFYSTTGRAGAADGDFVTSVESGTLFAEALAVQIDAWWHELGRPDPFVIVEGGSGVGTLCRNLWAAVDDCREALRYVMVERSVRQRTFAFDRVVSEAFIDITEVPLAAVADLPTGPLTGVVIANELLDNVSSRVVERTADGWSELFVDDGEPVLVPADEAASRMASSLMSGAAVGTRIPLQVGGAVWITKAQRLLERGKIAVFDYGAPTAELAERGWPEWVRTYRNHRHGAGLFEAFGQQDITFDVATDQLPGAPIITTQADWLRLVGIDDLTATSREVWETGRAKPDRATLAARVRLDEAAALLDPAALGGFFVATWDLVVPRP